MLYSRHSLLTESVYVDRKNDNHTAHQFLKVGRNTEQVHTVIDNRDQQRTDQRTPYTSPTTTQAGSPNNYRRDDGEFIGKSRGWSRRVQSGSQDERTDRKSVV